MKSKDIHLKFESGGYTGAEEMPAIDAEDAAGCSSSTVLFRLPGQCSPEVGNGTHPVIARDDASVTILSTLFTNVLSSKDETLELGPKR